MAMKFNRVREVVDVTVRAKFHQAKCSGSSVIHSDLDFGQLWLWSRISLKRIKQSTSGKGVTNYDFSHVRENNLINFGPLTKKMVLTFEVWNSTGFKRLSRYMFTQNFIELSAALHELSCAQRNESPTKTIQPVATARTVNIWLYLTKYAMLVTRCQSTRPIGSSSVMRTKNTWPWPLTYDLVI